MSLLFLILMILACLLLALVVLVQNPKGGGLSGNIAGFSNQFMGVKQTTDVLEKGTWVMAAVVALLCLFSPLLVRDGDTADDKLIKSINPNTTNSAPAPAPAPMAPLPSPAK
jgi:preprotein translocase subunit SecG